MSRSLSKLCKPACECQISTINVHLYLLTTFDYPHSVTGKVNVIDLFYYI